MSRIQYFDHRRTRADQLLAQVMHEIDPYLKPDAGRDVIRALQDLFWMRGVQVVTDADRAAAGLKPRDTCGMTLEELAVLEHYHLQQMVAKMAPGALFHVDKTGRVFVALGENAAEQKNG